MKMTWLFNEIGNGCLIRTHLSIAYKESCAERDIKILIYFYILYLNWNQNNEDVPLVLCYLILFNMLTMGQCTHIYKFPDLLLNTGK